MVNNSPEKRSSSAVMDWFMMSVLARLRLLLPKLDDPTFIGYEDKRFEMREECFSTLLMFNSVLETVQYSRQRKDAHSEVQIDWSIFQELLYPYDANHSEIMALGSPELNQMWAQFVAYKDLPYSEENFIQAQSLLKECLQIVRKLREYNIQE